LREYAPTARPYELMTIFSPEVADDSVTEQLEVITGYVRTAGGAVYQVFQDAPWGRRRFAYPIRHNGRDVRDGFYSVVHFDLVPSQVFEVERDLKLDERVLRFLLTLNDTKEAPAETPETTEGEVVEAAPTVRSEIAAGDLVRNAEAARAAADAAREAQEAARAAAEAARPQQAGNRDDRPRQAAQPAPDVPAVAETTEATTADETAVTAPTEATAADVETTPATNVASEVGEVAPASETPVAETAPADPASPADETPADETLVTETEAAASDEPSERETVPADDTDSTRA